MNLNKIKTEGRLEEFPFIISCFEEENSFLILKNSCVEDTSHFLFVHRLKMIRGAFLRKRNFMNT